MKISQAILLFLIASPVICACPFNTDAGGDLEIPPNDAQHKSLRRRRLASLSEDEVTRSKLQTIIKRQQLLLSRELQSGDACVTTGAIEGLRATIQEMTDSFNNDRERGHFLGGIVRLAAHDFMDFDQAGTDANARLGSDGCLDFSHAANAGLPDLWCDDPIGCPLKSLYDTSYSAFMSRADFWIAAANAVIQNTSINRSLVLPFRWGRVDRDECLESSGRLPEPTGCSAIQNTFIDRMGVTWTDATALMGAHTLGRGDARFSGHDGTWVNNDAESTTFDKRFYEETVNRAWRPRDVQGVGSDWTWGGNNRGVMMLHTDICLRYDIPEGDDQTCCTLNPNNNNCGGDTSLVTCNSSATVRPEAFRAFEAFLSANSNNNQPFYDAFSEAWTKATENGYDDSSLFELVDSCGPSPTSSPSTTGAPSVASPTSSPSTTGAPSASSPTSSPSTTGAPTADCQDTEGDFVVKGKTRSCDWVGRDTNKRCGTHSGSCPVTCDVCGVTPAPSPSANCVDQESFKVNGRRRDCEWVLSTDKCNRFGNKCPVSCGQCG